MTTDFKEVLSFWFEEIPQKNWWIKDPAFDQIICDRFGDLHNQATENKLISWRQSAEGALAEIIVLDQFSRNIYRNKPESFACDSLAVKLCREAINKKFDQDLDNTKRGFLYMPLMHSESLHDHELANKMFAQKGLENMRNYEVKHKVIIERFGRYPHRNEILDRESSKEEIAFLKEPDSSF